MTDFKGVYANLPTPFDDGGDSLDLRRTDILIDFLLERGIHGMGCLLSSGEYPYLNESERNEFTRRVVERVAGRVPVIVGVSALTTRDAKALAREAEKAGADAAMVMPIQYWPMKTHEVIDHFKSISDATSLPLGIYDNPRLGAAPFTVDMYATLMSTANVRLSKDSSTVLMKIPHVREACGNGISILHGNHMEMLPAYLLGAPGVCNAIASVLPDICLELYELSVIQRNWEEARRRFEEVLPVFRFFEEHSLARCVKEASEMMGRPLGPQRRPLTGLGTEDRQALASILRRFGYLD